MNLRLDPWASSYDGPVVIDDSEIDEGPQVDTSMETDTWAPIEPSGVTEPKTTAFVDGVQRVEEMRPGAAAAR